MRGLTRKYLKIIYLRYGVCIILQQLGIIIDIVCEKSLQSDNRRSDFFLYNIFFKPSVVRLVHDLIRFKIHSTCLKLKPKTIMSTIYSLFSITFICFKCKY